MYSQILICSVFVSFNFVNNFVSLCVYHVLYVSITLLVFVNSLCAEGLGTRAEARAHC